MQYGKKERSQGGFMTVNKIEELEKHIMGYKKDNAELTKTYYDSLKRTDKLVQGINKLIEENKKLKKMIRTLKMEQIKNV